MAEMTKRGPKQTSGFDREVVFALPERSQLIGVLGAHEVFDAANRMRVARGKPAPYRLRVVGHGPTATSASGLGVRVAPIADVRSVHTLVLGGGLELGDGRASPRFLREADRLIGASERVVSICAGALLLADLGHLEGRRCTTHWMLLDALRERAPGARVEDDALFTADGAFHTSAGASAGIDLALDLVRHDHGPKLATAIARSLVVFAQRPGGQSQFGSAQRLVPTVDERIRAQVSAIVRAPGEDHAVPRLAARAGVSERHFARLFRAETGATPAAFVARARVEAAERALLGSDATLDAIADDCGFAGERALRRAFVRIKGVTPSAFRSRFRVA